MSRLLPAVLAAAHLAERTGLEVEQEDVEFYASVYPVRFPGAQPASTPWRTWTTWRPTACQR